MPGLVSRGFCGREKICGEWSVSSVCDLPRTYLGLVMTVLMCGWWVCTLGTEFYVNLCSISILHLLHRVASF